MTTWSKLWIAAFSLTAAAVAGCTNEEDLGDRSQGSPSSNVTTESSYLDACGARASRCGGTKPDNCAEQYKCYSQAFVESYATELFDCLSSRSCDETPQLSCLRPLANRVGDKVFQSKCDDRMGECSLNDDYCQDESALLKPEVRAAFETCLQKDCGAIQACLVAAVPACRF